jgi:hypothetical protein
MYDRNFRNAVLFDPIKQGANNLKIVSGYATHTMASWHITEIEAQGFNPINITLIVGMCKFDGISVSVHNGFNSLVSENRSPRQSSLKCQYVVDGSPVHSKLYLWEKNGHPFLAFMGSVNYTQSAFSISRRELVVSCDPGKAALYFDKIEADTMYCNHAEIEDKIRILPTHPVLQAEETPAMSVRGSGVQRVTLSLLARGDETGIHSGLNWGQRSGREPNQAYIKLPIKIARTDFFPLEGNLSGKHNPHFSVLTDDGINLILRVEQQNNKAITTPLNNSLIGEYFRNRMGVANGAFVTRQDLENYGRTNVTFYKIGDEQDVQYFMDFSV